MPCYSPIPALNLGKGVQPKILPRRVDYNLDELKDKYGKDLLLLPCGRCLGCELDYAKKWSVRIMLEASLYSDNCFITLTFLDAFMPRDEFGASLLLKKPFVKFMKRLRKKVGFCRFFMCGERGPLTGRPHYHAILFGYKPSDLEFLKTTASGENIYTSKELSSLWPFGFVSVGEVTTESASYCARYTMKKHSDSKEGIVDDSFINMSRKPGIGRDCFNLSWFNVSKIYLDGQGISVPRFFQKVLEKEDPSFFEKWKAERDKIEFPDKRYAYGLSHTDEVLKFTESLQKSSFKFLRSQL